MEPQETSLVEKTSHLQSLNTVTPVSKYLALALFIILPFLGAYVGYMLAPVKVIENPVFVDKNVEIQEPPAAELPPAQKEYVSPNGYSLIIPISAVVAEVPAQFTYSPSTIITGDFGKLCISLGYACGGVGMQGWTPSTEVLVTQDGRDMTLTVWQRDDEVYLVMQSLSPLPPGVTEDTQIHFHTNKSQRELVDAMLRSLTFTGSDSLVVTDTNGLFSFTLPPEWRLTHIDGYIQLFNFPELTSEQQRMAAIENKKGYGVGENKIEGGHITDSAGMHDFLVDKTWSDFTEVEIAGKKVYILKLTDRYASGWPYAVLAIPLPNEQDTFVSFAIYGDDANFDSVIETLLSDFVFLN